MTTRSGSIPDRRARSGLLEYARIDLPVRVRLKNQKTAVTTMNAEAIVIACDDLMATPSVRPVISLNARAFRIKRSPSLKLRSSGPTMNLVIPPITNMTPMETMR